MLNGTATVSRIKTPDTHLRSNFKFARTEIIRCSPFPLGRGWGEASIFIFFDNGFSQSRNPNVLNNIKRAFRNEKISNCWADFFLPMGKI